MNKSEFVSAVALKADINQAAAKVAVDSVLAVITDAIKADDQIALVGFGTFKPKNSAAREGINPATGAKINIAAKKGVGFKAGKGLLEAIK
ncbi:MAG: HU family DNA-binding protein [Clostridia bacterium]